jgi:uncharacterized protein
MGDRKVRIEVGQGLEGTIPDITASRIIREAMVPEFRQDQYGRGLMAGAQAIVYAVEHGGEIPLRPQQRRRGQDPLQFWIFIGFIILMMLFNVLSRALGFGGRRTAFWNSGYWGGGGFGGGGFGGGGGGGFSGGGGGGFSGGGASGGW